MILNFLFDNVKKVKNVSILFIICIISFFLIFPAINNNIHDHNMILYFNADEGGIMDVIWMYFSGQKVESLQFDFDYGLELLYLSDFIRLFISPFVEVSPCTLLFVIRCIHSFAWIGAIIALWKLVGNHFGKGWQQMLAIFLLAVRPAFPYVLNSSKPDILVLLLMIVGLDYILMIIDKPRMKYLLVSIICASTAFLIKYSGVFLLVAIIAAVFLSRRYNDSKSDFEKVFFIPSEIKRTYLFPSVIGITIIILPLILIFFYERKSTGITFYEEFGILGTVKQKKLILFIWSLGISLILLSLTSWILNKKNTIYLRKIVKMFNEVNSYAIICCGIFCLATIFFGFRWFFDLKNFILVYAQLGTSIAIKSTVNDNGLLYLFFQNIIEKINAFDTIVVLLFIFYIWLEAYSIHKNLKDDLLKLIAYKRIVLLVFLIVPFIYMFTMLRFAQHHMLPFFVVMSVLVIQSLTMFKLYHSCKKINYMHIIKFLIILFLAFDIVLNGITVIKGRVKSFNQHKDIAYELAEWWRQNIPKAAKIVADHPTRVYIPPEYKGVKILRSYKSECLKKDVVQELRELVNEYRPQFIYYNLGKKGMPKDDKPWSPINEMLPDKKVKLIKTFESAGRRHQRFPDDKFVIYQVYYDEEPKW